MKIGQHPDIPASLPPAGGPAAPKTSASAGASADATSAAAQSKRSAGVAVSVSQAALALEKADRTQTAEIDAKKVASVRAAIQDGSYKVDAEAIADKLLANAQEMLKRTQQ
jgi:negative regulator of flagellin synthesis FlgM